MMDRAWLDSLACPWCVTRPQGTTLAKCDLEFVGPQENPTGLRCAQCGRVYEIRDGSPNLIIENAAMPKP